MIPIISQDLRISRLEQLLNFNKKDFPMFRKKKFILLFFLYSLCLFSSFSQVQGITRPKLMEEDGHLFDKMVDAYNQKDFDKSLGFASQLISKYPVSEKPDYYYLYVARGGIYIKLGRYAEALKDIETALGVNPNDLTGIELRGSVYFRTGRYSDSIAEDTRVLSLAPQKIECYNSRGEAYCKLGKYEEALADFTEFIKRNDTYALVYSNRGWVYIKLGEYEKALKDISKAIQLDNNCSEYLKNRGVVHLYLKQQKEALADFEKALELADTDSEKQEIFNYIQICTKK